MKTIRRTTMAILIALVVALSVSAAPESVIVGGGVIGLNIHTDGVVIVEFSENAPQKAGLKRGDILQKIDGIAVNSVEDVAKAVENSDGSPMTLTVLRNGKEKTVKLAPTNTEEGKRLGLLVRDKVSGVGTLTYYDPESGTFGALGHGIHDGTTLLPLETGNVLPSQIVAVTKSTEGEPGYLQGMVCGRRTKGEILKNTPQGIFGTMQAVEGQELTVAKSSEIHTGTAQILSNVSGTEVCAYDVRILSIYPNESHDRNLLLEVTDADLLARTGGIVQGMSGSPIIQDGKLIGAVTHVLIDEPSRGYGIFIENMLAAAG